MKSIITFIAIFLVALTPFADETAAIRQEIATLPTHTTTEILDIAEAYIVANDIDAAGHALIGLSFDYASRSWQITYDNKPDKDGFKYIGSRFGLTIADGEASEIRYHPGR